MAALFRPFYRIRFIHRSRTERLESMQRLFAKNQQHEWIQSHAVFKKVFENFFKILPDEILDFMLANPSIHFIAHQGKNSGTYYSSPKSHIVLIFPDTLKLLLSALPTLGLAVLAHEIGHIYYRHTDRSISLIRAQIEADFFTFKVGLGEELISVLEDETASECEIRLKYLRMWQQNFHYYNQQDYNFITKEKLA